MAAEESEIGLQLAQALSRTTMSSSEEAFGRRDLVSPLRRGSFILRHPQGETCGSHQRQRKTHKPKLTEKPCVVE